jgi:hypothetical protein
MTEEDCFVFDGAAECNIAIPDGIKKVSIAESVILCPIILPASVTNLIVEDCAISAIHLPVGIKTIEIYNCPGVNLVFPANPMPSLEIIRVNGCGIKTFDITSPTLKEVDLCNNELKTIEVKWPFLEELNISGNDPNIAIKHMDFIFDKRMAMYNYTDGDYWKVLTRGEFSNPVHWPESALFDLIDGNPIHKDFHFNRHPEHQIDKDALFTEEGYDHSGVSQK